MKNFFKPTAAKIIIFGFFLLIVYLGYTQGWVFSGKQAGVPKPLLFDFFAWFPAWVIWMYLTVPISFLMNIDFPDWLSWSIQVIYFCVLSCLIIFVITRIKSGIDRLKNRNRGT